MDHAKYYSRAFCLVLMGVLILGLVQWSFLPLLMDGRMASCSAVLTITGGHTAKFAAPFKCPFDDSTSTCLLETRQCAPVIVASFVCRVENTSPHRESVFHSDRLLRAPPSV